MITYDRGARYTVENHRLGVVVRRNDDGASAWMQGDDRDQFEADLESAYENAGNLMRLGVNHPVDYVAAEYDSVLTMPG